ncbi:hypothetical protein BDW02DRAFT_574012 [Decorospora gaudefroyi]|uniref:Uncharacterized protein n=1 Tax=Decorospora gaudefroyi TaxID=184978 RepID=A0A6A5K4X7_9PLEO|nr:hypothetical protein BDW02DRAFT_574012 [Decorospora gaudefroyi]
MHTDSLLRVPIAVARNLQSWSSPTGMAKSLASAGAQYARILWFCTAISNVDQQLED